MRKPTVQPNTSAILRQFEQLEKLLIDASSIIYMVKANYFECVSDNLILYSPESMLRETGYHSLNVQPIPTGNTTRPPDDDLVLSAQRLHWPVITEDLNIIRRLSRGHLSHFNALMMLEFLFFRKFITVEGYSRHLKRLLSVAWYSAEVVRFGEQIHQKLVERA